MCMLHDFRRMTRVVRSVQRNLSEPMPYHLIMRMLRSGSTGIRRVFYKVRFRVCSLIGQALHVVDCFRAIPKQRDG